MGMENSFKVKTKYNEVLINWWSNFISLHNYIRDNFDGKVDDTTYNCSVKDLKLLKVNLETVYKELLNIGEEGVCFYDTEEYPASMERVLPLVSNYYFRPVRDCNGFKIMKLYNTVTILIDILNSDFDKEYEVVYECSQ